MGTYEAKWILGRSMFTGVPPICQGLSYFRLVNIRVRLCPFGLFCMKIRLGDRDMQGVLLGMWADL